jgi:hypothetical protein
MSAPVIDVSDSSFSPLIPTPAAQEPGGTAERFLERKNRDGCNRKPTSVQLTHFVQLLPTPAVNDMGEGKTPEAWDEWTEKMQAKHQNGNGHGKSLAIEAMRLMPTPTVDDASNVTRDSGEYQSLTRAVRMMPTPNASDFRGSTSPESAKDWEQRGVNLPERIQRLRGATTAPPSNDTPEPSDDQLRLL